MYDRECEIQDIRTIGLAGLGSRLRDVGYGRMDGKRRYGVARVARPSHRARLQLLRYRVGLRRRTQRASAGRNASQTLRPSPVRGDENPAEESTLAGEA